MSKIHIFFFQTECPDDTSKELGDEVVATGRTGGRKQAKHKQTSIKRTLKYYYYNIYVSDALLTPSKFETSFAPNSGFPNVFLKEVDEEEAMEGQNDTNKPCLTQMRVIESWWDGIGKWKA